MCGIACLFDLQGDPKALRERAVAMARLLRHRGPDWSGIYADDNAVLAHERLAIVDVQHGAQPLTGRAGTPNVWTLDALLFHSSVSSITRPLSACA